MADDATLVIAALAVFITVMMWLIRAVTGALGEAGAQLRVLDARLVDATPALAERMERQRATLAAVSTQTERALWSLARFDERADAAREALAASRIAFDNGRARLIAARDAIVRVKKTARLFLKMLELRRAFLG
jgi:hypothetical protein